MDKKEINSKKDVAEIIKEYKKMTLMLNLFANTNLLFIFIISIYSGYIILFGENFYSNSVISFFSDMTSSEKIINQNFTMILTTFISVKITFLTITIFVLQILYKTYRYNLKLSDHYRSRANILMLKENLDWEISDLKEIFTFDHIDIGSTPKSDGFNVLNKIK